MNKKLLLGIIPAILLFAAAIVMANTCPSGTTPIFVETITVPSDGSSVSSACSLESGATYLLEASGTFTYNSAGDWADAEWYLKNGVVVKGDTEGSKPYVLDISIDGYLINRDWGDYNALHVYTMLLDGTGSKIDFSIYDSYSGDNLGSLTVDIYKCVADSDNDGIPDTEDNCPLIANSGQVDTDEDGIGNVCDSCSYTIPDVDREVPSTGNVGVNRFVWNGGSEFYATPPKGEGPQKSFTIEDTHGCSCAQILDMMGGKMNGHKKFGCSISVLEDFVANAQPPIFVETVKVYAYNPDKTYSPTYSTIELESDVQYELEAIGTAYAGGKYPEDIEFDAKYSITHSESGDSWTDAVTNYESLGPTLLDLFVNGGSVNWGACNTEHAYYWTVTGTGVKLELWIYDTYPSNNTGFITVNIYRLP